MRMADFIKENREELDACINSVVGRVPRTASCYCHLSGTDHQHEAPRLNDSERRDWIMNDEGLYNWAWRSGVRV